MRTIFLILILIFSLGCSENRKCRYDSNDIAPISFNFTIINDKGEDLFFGQGAEFDPKKVIETNKDSNFVLRNYLGLLPDSKCFYLYGFYLTSPQDEYTFLFEFFPEKIDTILIKASKEQECVGFWFNYDAYYNGELICIDCSYVQTYKIKRL